MTRAQRTCVYVGVALAMAYAPSAWAADSGSFDRITDLYKNGAASWEGVLLDYARGLFALLVTIEIAWTMIRLTMKNADFSEFAAEVVNRMMFVGFFGWLLTNSSTFARAIVDSFRQAGNEAAMASGGTGGIRPSDIFDAGMNMATTVLMTKVELSLTGVGQSVALMIAAVLVCACFALIGAFLICALVESYIVVSAGVILMGFGGSRWTKDYAIKALTYALSVGAKLFCIQLIAGLGEAMIKTQALAVTPASSQKPEDVLVVVGFALVMVVLTKTIPDTVQGLINGTSVSTSGGALLAGMVGGAVAGAAGQALGVGAAVGGAYKLADQQLNPTGAPETKPGLRAMTAQAMDNITSAVGSDVGARLGGRAKGGTMPGRMGFEMSAKAAELAREAQKSSLPVLGSGQQPEMAMAGAASGGAAAEGIIRPGGANADAGAAAEAAPQSGGASGTVDPAAHNDSDGTAEATVRGADGGAEGPSERKASDTQATHGATATASEEAADAKPSASGLGGRTGGQSGGFTRGTVRGAPPSNKNNPPDDASGS